MPFVPRMNEVNREGKVVKFETMSDFNAEEMSIKATPLTNFTSENFPGKPLLISTESDQLYSKTGGYALTFHNYGYVSNSSYAADYTSGDGISTNAEVAVKVPTDEVDLGNGAVLKGTYTKLMLDNGSSNFWLFSAADETTAINTISNYNSTINNSVYDLQGRKVADNLSSRIPNPSSQKGIYIVNGKKIVIK